MNPASSPPTMAFRRTMLGKMRTPTRSQIGQASPPKHSCSRCRSAFRSFRPAPVITKPFCAARPGYPPFFSPEPPMKLLNRLVNSMGKMNLVEALVPIVFKVSKYCRVIVF